MLLGRACDPSIVHVRRIEVGEPEIALNNVLRGYRSFRAVFR